MHYFSTRGENKQLTASQAILKGIAGDGGLYVPEEFPAIAKSLTALSGLSYQDLAFEILKPFLTDFTEAELRSCIAKAYDSKFDTPLIAPVVEAGGCHFLELFHGPTLAFKDMALSLLPHLLMASAKKQGIHKKIVILTATSGDTGKAALEGFKNVENTQVFVFYPHNGVSPLQEKQMVTQEGDNVCVAAIDGNFDDAQTAVKTVFTDYKLMKKLEQSGFLFSSANSINIGRLLPQIAYYFYGYFQMMAPAEIEKGLPINICVPTGNFGNILAAYYARQMGLPIQRLICASNENKVLYDFFETGTYDKNRDLVVSASPSMDIIVSSNLERLLYHLAGEQGQVKSLMEQLNQTGKYQFDTKSSCFTGEYATEQECFDSIKALYEQSGYIMDTHTAVAYTALQKYRKKTGDATKTLVAATASPYKFAGDVMQAIDSQYKGQDPFELIETMSQLLQSPVPEPVKDLKNKKVQHMDRCAKDGIKHYIVDHIK